LYLASLLVFWLLAREQQARAVVTHPAVFTGLALIAFANLSVLWGHGPEAMEYLRWAPGMMTFCLALVLACQVPDRPLLWLANGLLLIAAASTVYALAHYLMAGNLQERNYGPNLLFSPILGPSIIVSLAATGQMLRQHQRQPN
ncbi:hypothetical protein HN240_18955, partial [Acinetobacter baumannii]|uniref:hypothetical protein n=1 Tax=Acinetobacter baumannii TaxID=470 RepID=UPI001898C9AC